MTDLVDRLRTVLPTEEAGRAFVRQRMAKLLGPGGKWHRSPTAYALERLGIRLTDDQSEVCEAVATTRQVSWRAAQKVGKSTCIAVLALWWYETRDRALVVMTSGNASQVKVILWRELRRLATSAPLPVEGSLHLDPSNGLVGPDGRLVVGLTADEPERLQGYSGANLLFLVDEASGFSDELLEAIMGNLAGGGRVLLCGNPTKSVGLFARTHRSRLAGWRLKHSSAYDSPNVQADREISALPEHDADAVERINSRRVTGMAETAWIEQMVSTFGADSAAVAVRVKGEYAAESDNSVIGLALVTEATARWREDTRTTHPLEVGVDPARFGDDETVIQGRRGEHALVPWAGRKLDNVEVAAKVLDLLFGDAVEEGWARPGEKPVVRVDVGGLGSGVVDVLRRDVRVTVVAVNAAADSRHPTRFRNTRAELWWCIRRWLERGGCMPPDDRRDAELLAAKYGTDVKMRVEIESKDHMKKQLGHSPDRADALALAVYGESPLQDGERKSMGAIAQPGAVAHLRPGSMADAPREDSGRGWRPGDGPPPRRHGW